MAAIVSELAPSGLLIAGINLGNPVIAQRDPDGGDPRGVGPELARELARRAGVPVRFVTYATAGKLADAVKQGAWDVAFLAIDPERAADIEFSDAYVHIEGVYLVPADSPLRSIEDVDREGIRIAVGRKTAYDLYLSRNLENAQLVRCDSSRAAIDQFVAEKLEAVAGVKQPLAAHARGNSALRLLEGSFMLIRQAAGVPRGRPAAWRYLAAFIEEAKASGLVARALAHSGMQAVTIAPVLTPHSPRASSDSA